jgi:hypothetical protein
MTQTKQKRGESAKVRDARWRRAQELGIQVQRGQQLAAERLYPRSLMDICTTALEREYQLRKRSVKP